MSKYIAFNINHPMEKLKEYSDWLDTLKFDKKVTYLSEGTGLEISQIEKIITSINPYKILHIRISDEVIYKTLFVGNEESLLVNGFMTSGYIGGGPGLFSRALNALSVDKDIIDGYIYKADNYSKDTVITIIK